MNKMSRMIEQIILFFKLILRMFCYFSKGSLLQDPFSMIFDVVGSLCISELCKELDRTVNLFDYKVVILVQNRKGRN